MDISNIQYLLEKKVEEFEREEFIYNDPIQIPHSFSILQDIEISAFFAAILAWGNRASIIKSCKEILRRMDYSPSDYVQNASEMELCALQGFVYRTFNDVDIMYFVKYLNHHYSLFSTLEDAFLVDDHFDAFNSINHFHKRFFSLPDAPSRTQKHISFPLKNSAAKRINMFLRWMVRKNSPVDFGIWHRIQPQDLMLPLDVHTSTVSRYFNLLHRKTNDWKAVEEVTNALRKFDNSDPIKYDFALFGMGVNKELI